MRVEKQLDQRAPLVNVARDMARASENAAYGGDIEVLTASMWRLVEQAAMEMEVVPILEVKDTIKRVNQGVVRTGSNLLGSASWADLASEAQADAALSVVRAVEESAFQVAKAIDRPLTASIMEVEANIVMEVDVVSGEDDVAFPDQRRLRAHDAWHGDCITLPAAALQQLAEHGLARVVFVLYKNMQELLKPPQVSIEVEVEEPGVLAADGSPTEYSAGRPPYKTEADRDAKPAHDDKSAGDSEKQDDGASDDRRPHTIVNTNIISASVNKPAAGGRQPLRRPVVYTLQHKTQDNVYNPSCSFWEYETRMQDGRWSQFGCKLLATNTTHTTCACSHLTNFAVLMDVMGTALPARHQLGLTVVTYVGLSISLVCLLLAFITFCVFKNLQCDRNTIHKNLVLCLFLAELVFLAGIAQHEHQVACAVVAGLLHYLFLAAFSWMCLEGVQLYVMLVEVFEAERSRRGRYYVVAYGVPAVIVTLSAAVNPSGYGTPHHCWLDAASGHIWAFVAPVVCVLTVNVVMLSIALHVMCRHAHLAAQHKAKERSRVDKISLEQRNDKQIWSWVKGAAVLVVLLGLTWATGLLYVSARTAPLAYCFTVLNSLQGLAIFTFHCLMDERVQKEYKRVVRRCSLLPDCVRVGYGGASTSYLGRESSSSKLWWSKRKQRESMSSLPRSHSRSSTPLAKSNYAAGELWPVCSSPPVYANAEPAEDPSGYLAPVTCPHDYAEVAAINVDKYKIGGGEPQADLSDMSDMDDPDAASPPSYDDALLHTTLGEKASLSVSDHNLMNSLEDDDTLKLKKRLPDSVTSLNDLNRAYGSDKSLDLSTPNICLAGTQRAASLSSESGRSTPPLDFAEDSTEGCNSFTFHGGTGQSSA